MASGNKNIAEYGKGTQFASGSQAVTNGRKGGKASVRSKQKQKTIAETMKLMLDTPVTDEKQLATIKKAGLPVPEQPTYKDFMAASIMLRTIQKGRVDDLEKLAGLIGEGSEDTAALDKLDEVLKSIKGLD